MNPFIVAGMIAGGIIVGFALAVWIINKAMERAVGKGLNW